MKPIKLLLINTLRRADLVEAGRVYQVYISHFPEVADGYRELGVIQEKLQDFDGQVNSYHKALSISDEQPCWVYITLARRLAERERKSEAIELYRLGLERDIDSVDGLSYAELARLLSEQDDANAALVGYQKAIGLQPDLEWGEFLY